ncbi:TIGR03013 family XrtA/PEP-CTERM system glycosyltransferase [Thalassotalea maritima]|uniref:TIGR03013 family XrtA/PEP-CTERM system glycosyltransferase n=1 Tax=Thalassotalea maritima TaxID=3242416 RepID=UPI003528484D
MQTNYHNHTRWAIKLLIVIDFALLVLSLLAVTQIISISSPGFKSPFVLFEMLIAVLILQLMFFSLGLYQSRIRETFWGIVQRVFVASALAFALLIIILLLMSNTDITQPQLLQFCVLSFLLCTCLRIIFYKLNVLSLVKRNVLVLGAGKRSGIIRQRMRRKVDRQTFNLHGFVAMRGDAIDESYQSEALVQPDSLLQYAIDHNIHEIIIASDERRNNLPIDELFYCRVRGIEVTEILDFIEKETGQIAVNLMYPSWLIHSTGFRSQDDLRNSLDYLFNVFLALLLLMLTWPLLLLAMIAIKFEDGLTAPIFYRQARVGLRGRIFNIVKFRSMCPDAEKAGARWASAGDSRITKVGRVLRKYRIDELPQIFNVLSGDMSFVGPRPERPEFVDQLKQKIPYYDERHNVKVGLTGWAQLKYPYGASEKDAEEKLKFDLYYIKHRGFLLDLRILLQTAEVVVFGRGR